MTFRSRVLCLFGWLAASGGLASCTFPDYRFAPEPGAVDGPDAASAGVGGISDAPVPAAGAAAAASAGACAYAGGAGAAGGGGSDAGAGGAAVHGGAAGDAGAGGASEPPRCADFTYVAESCRCEEYGGHAYFFCTAARSFATASTFCSFDGLKLARVDDSQENGWIAQTATAADPPLVFYWIGASAERMPGTWRWPDGEAFWQGAMDGSVIGSNFAAWRVNAPTDPATTEPDELCAYVGADGWEDTYCSDQRAYVCEWY